MSQRKRLWQQLHQSDFDVVVVGGGISGAALFRKLCQQNYRCLIIDQSDFASGTSQASGMLIWGGLLYLKNLDLRTVVQLSRARDQLIRDLPNTVRPATFRYLSRLSGTRPGWLVRAALEAYWWLGGCRRQRPKREPYFQTRSLLAKQRFGDSITYEEACLPKSDANLVLRWIEEGLAAQPHSVALNYCQLKQADFQSPWRLDLIDQRHQQASTSICARLLVNAAGVWADQINQSIGLRSKHHHVFSKGVYLGLPRPAGLNEFLAFEMGAHGDTLTYTPWGPIALWGPTETPIETLEDAFTPNADDLRFLLESARANLRHQFMPQDIVSLRSGVRPLAVQRSYSGKDYPLDLSRRCVVDVDAERYGLTLYGGKLTSAPKMAKDAALKVRALLGEATAEGAGFGEAVVNGLEIGEATSGEGALPSETTMSNLANDISLYDYLRRRTNISQWTPRLGLGRHNEYREFLHQLAVRFHGAEGANDAIDDLEARAHRQDELLQQIF